MNSITDDDEIIEENWRREQAETQKQLEAKTTFAGLTEHQQEALRRGIAWDELGHAAMQHAIVRAQNADHEGAQVFLALAQQCRIAGNDWRRSFR